jgi:hypothetical protein
MRSPSDALNARFKKRSAVSLGRESCALSNMQGAVIHLDLRGAAGLSVVETGFPLELRGGSPSGRSVSRKMDDTPRFFNHGSFALALPSRRSSPPSPPFGVSRSPLVETGFPRFRSPHHV